MSSALVVRLVFWVWLGAAVLAGQQLLLQRIPPIGVQACILGLAAVLVTAYFRVSAIRSWVDRLDLRTVVLVHVTRFVGIYFILLYRRGVLPYDFAVPGGIGDIVVATLALAIVLIPLTEAALVRTVRVWNIVGLVDISLVVITAARLNLANPLQMRALTSLPLSLLPTFLVPLIIATHIIILARLARNQTTA
jgi:hypothetical protein